MCETKIPRHKPLVALAPKSPPALCFSRIRIPSVEEKTLVKENFSVPMFSLCLTTILLIAGCQGEKGREDSAPEPPPPVATGEVRGNSANNAPTDPAQNIQVVFEDPSRSSPDGERVPPPAVEPHNPLLGPDSATVSMVVFASFDCPFSRRLPPVLKTLHDTYPDTLQIAFKHAVKPHSRMGRRAAERTALLSSEAFWKKQEELFGLSELTEEGLEAAFPGPAPTAEDQKEAEIRVEQDLALAEELRVRGTPQSFINGTRITGVKDIEEYKKLIDQALQKNRENGGTR